MRRAGLLTLLVAAFALAAVDRAGADQAAQLRPVDLRVEGGEASWHANDRFRLEWERPPIADQGFPISAVGYRVRDPAGDVVREKRVDGDRTLLNVQVPPLAAAYTAEIWLEGPGGAPGPAVSAALRYDHARPGTAHPLVADGWIAASAAAAIAVEAPPAPLPVSGLRGYAVSIDRGGESWPCAVRDSCGEAEIDLAAGEEGPLWLGTLPEGINVVRVLAVSGAGVPSAEAGAAVLRVDATHPAVTLAAAAEGWADGPVGVVASATDALSGMAEDGPNGPFTAIALDGGVPRVERGGSVAVTVTGEGVHRVDAFARDAAGNVGDRRAATTRVAIDETPPRVAFANAQDPAEPERIEALVTDALSGVEPSRGTIAVRASGTSRPWQPLPTRRTAERLVARWDSDSHPAGIYEFRATAYDAAGNAASSDRRANRTRMALVNPLKTPVQLRAGFAPARGLKAIPYGRRVAYRGRLIAATGAPLGDRPVLIVERFGVGAAVSERSTRAMTAADGTFSLRLPAGPSRKVEASFAGTRTLSRAESGGARLAVLAGVRLRPAAKLARVGGAPVLFSGRVRHRGARLPAGGLPVELQFRIPGGDWAEFRTVQTDARGRFRYPYAFSDDDSRGVRFLFRAYISGGGWPYEPAASKAVSVTGR